MYSDWIKGFYGFILSLPFILLFICCNSIVCRYKSKVIEDSKIVNLKTDRSCSINFVWLKTFRGHFFHKQEAGRSRLKTYRISSYSFLPWPWIHSFLIYWGNYVFNFSLHTFKFSLKRENLMRKLYDIFKLLWIQKRIVAVATILEEIRYS